MSEQEELNQPTPEPGLFDDYLSQQQYTEATMGQRFVNYLVDNLLMRFALSYLTGTIVGALLGILFPEYMSRIIYEQTSFDLLLMAFAVGVVNYLFYYTICEKVFRGYTLGKLVSGTRAIREDGGELTFKDAILRTLSRMVPFEPLSGFSPRPWHDSWTKTIVIKAR